MEAEKRVGEIDWTHVGFGLEEKWAVAQIDRVVNQQMTAVENDANLKPDEKKLKVNEIEKAWQRILRG